MAKIVPNDLMHFKLTYSLIALNLFFYIVSFLYSGNFIDQTAEDLAKLGAIFGPFVVADNEWWRLISAMFLHGGMTHLLMNMFSLYIIGRPMELYFPTRHYLAFYLFTGIIGGMLSIYIHPLSVSIGASGAIFGLFGALAGYFLAFRHELGTHSKDFMRDFGLIIAINILIGFGIPSIDVSAHAGGLISGFIGGYMTARHLERLWIFILLSMLSMLIFYQLY